MICTITPTSTPSFIGVATFCCCFSILTFNFSNAVFTSCIFSKIEYLWFSMFSHTSFNRSSTIVAINYTYSIINDVSMGFLWALDFFLEPLGCSTGLFLWASGGSYASAMCVSLSVSYPSPSSIETSCISIYFSTRCTCSVVSLVVHSVSNDPYVEPRWDGFFILVFFFM
jgi:hypothetical protein